MPDFNHFAKGEPKQSLYKERVSPVENLRGRKFFLSYIIQNNGMVRPMEDNSGKKFSLQDWVMKRAANQSGAAMPSQASRRVQPKMEMDEEVEVTQAESVADAISESLSVEVEMKAVSNGATISAGAPAAPSEKTEEKLSPKEEAKAQRREEIKEEIRDAAALTGTQNPLQQLQIVRLLTDLGDRLRQSEKEREVLWKELEICRKQIADMNGLAGKTEKSFHEMESQINQREVFVKELVEKQIGLEQQLKDQLAALEASKQDQAKLQDKINSVETAAGSAIVRVEDAISENTKLAKRVEQLGQDKARLIRKLEVVEETLVQTQDTLKAKALVLLTDQAVAARTNLPQTPAWTGDDTLKMSAAVSAPSGQAAPHDTGPVADLAASLRPKSQTPPMTLMQLAVVVAIVSLLFGSVAIYAFVKLNPLSAKKPVTESVAPSVSSKTGDAAEDQLKDLATKIDTAKTPVEQDKMMAEAAQIASQIEPGNLTEEDTQTDAPEEFQSAQQAQDKAVADFKAAAPTTAVPERIRTDKALPQGLRALEKQAFSGDVASQHDLAALYTAGQAGVKVNYTRAAKWFEEAAHNGSANAQYNLAVLHHQGLGVEKDTAKAIDLYRVAAANNHPEALYNLAIAYIEGVGVEYNPHIAAVYFERAARGGIVEAAYNLGMISENGLLGESQPDEAVFWYSLAANKGNADAAKALAHLKSQLKISDTDAAQTAQKVADGKTGFIGADGKPSLPDQQKEVKKASSTSTPPAVASAPVAAAPVTADPVIVSQIQDQLSRQGLFAGVSNGMISPELTQSIKSYQQKNGLKVDGHPSDDLLVQMLASGVQKEAQKETQKDSVSAKNAH